MKAEYNISKTVGHDDWRGMRLTLDGQEGETPQQLMDRVALEVDNWFSNRYGSIDAGAAPTQQAPPREIKVDKVPEEERVSKLIEDLNTCTSVKILESYKLIAKLNPAVQAAYELKLKELTEGK